ncbi:MAG: hypothetical protein ACK4XK_10845 [Casimicrobiaceae bacterium]
MKRVVRWIAGVMSVLFVAETIALSFLPTCHAPSLVAGWASGAAMASHGHTPADEGALVIDRAAASHHASQALADRDASAHHPVNSPDDGRDPDGAVPVDRFACCHLLGLSADVGIRTLPCPAQDIMLPASRLNPSDWIERIERPPRRG